MSAGRRAPTRGAWARALVGLAIAAVGLAIAFRRIDVAALGAALGGASWSWFLVGCCLTVLAVAVRAWRWRLLLAPIERIGVGQLFSATMIGYFGNGVLPLRLGELMRAAAIGGRRAGGLDVSTALGSVAVERLLDVASALGVAVLVVPFSNGLGGGIAAWAGAAVLVVAGFVGLLLASRSPRVRSVVARRTEAIGHGHGAAARFGGMARSFLRGVLVLGEGPALLPIGLQTVGIWALYFGATWTAARAAGLTLSWLETGLVLVGTTVAASVPAAPGYVGTYHAAVVLVTADLLGHDVPRAQAFAILSHASSWLPTVTIGGGCLLRSSMRLDEVVGVPVAGPPAKE